MGEPNEPLLLQQLESPSGTGRDEPRSQTTLPDSHQQQTRMQTSTRILTGSYALPIDTEASIAVTSCSPAGRFGSVRQTCISKSSFPPRSSILTVMVSSV